MVDRKFLYYKHRDKFNEDLQDGNIILPTSIVFIEDDKTIWTHGTEFNCNSLLDRINEISNELSAINNSIIEINNFLNETLQDIIAEALRQHDEISGDAAQDLKNALDRLAEAEEKIKYLQEHGSSKDDIQRLAGLVLVYNERLDEFHDALVEYEKVISVVQGYIQTEMSFTDTLEQIRTEYLEKIDVVKGQILEELKKIDIENSVVTAVGRYMESGLLKDYVTYALLSDEETITSFINRLSEANKDYAAIKDLVSWKNDTTESISALLQYTDSLKSFWLFSANWKDTEEGKNFISAILGYAGEDGSFIKLIAENIIASGKLLIQDGDICISINNDGIRQWKDINRDGVFDNGEETNFFLGSDGTGYLGKEEGGHHAIEWNADGVVKILKGDVYDGNDKFDWSTMGGYVQYAFCIKATTPTLPSSDQDFSGNKTDIIAKGSTDKWTKSAAGASEGQKVWMALRQVDKDGKGSPNSQWQGPYCISGADGIGGDSAGINFIYSYGDATAPYNSLDGVRSDNLGGWSDKASDVLIADEDRKRYSWMAFSTTKTKEGVYYDYTAVLWSVWGNTGIDGDGIQYIYYKTNYDVDWDNTTIVKPASWYSESNYQTGNQADGEYFKDGWDDDPQNIETGEYVWVSIRKYLKQHSTDTKKSWGPYSDPALWAYKPADGVTSGYVAEFNNDSIAVTVNQDGLWSADNDEGGTTPSTSADAGERWPDFTYSPTITVYKSDGTEFHSYESNTSAPYYKLTVGQISIAASRPAAPGTTLKWYSATVNSDGDGIDVVIKNSNYIEWYNDQVGVSTLYETPLSLKFQHIYIPVSIEIMDAGAASSVTLNRMVSVYGVYTGLDGEAGTTIDLRVTPIMVHKDRYTQEVSPTTITAWYEKAKGNEIPAQITPTTVSRLFDFYYKQNDAGTNVNSDLSTATPWPNSNTITIDSSTIFPLTVYLAYTDNTDPNNPVIRAIDHETVGSVLSGLIGPGGTSYKTSYIFCRMNCEENERPDTPIGGNYDTLMPASEYATLNNERVKVKNNDGTDSAQDVLWCDGIPAGEEMLWVSSYTFDDKTVYVNQNALAGLVVAEWSEPRKMTDNAINEYDVEFSPCEENPGDPTSENRSDGSYNGNNFPADIGSYAWFDPRLDKDSVDFTKMIWRAERWKENNVYTPWVIVKIKGEDGDPGADVVTLYLDNQDDFIPSNSSNNLPSNITLSTGVTLYKGGLPILPEEGNEITITVGDLKYGETTFVNPTSSTLTIAHNTQYPLLASWIIPRLQSGTDQLTVLPADKFLAVISVVYNGNTYTNTFGATVVKGEQGLGFPTVHQLVLDRNQFLLYKTGTATYDLSKSYVESNITLRKLVSGDGTTEVQYVDGLSSDYNNFFIKCGITGTSSYDQIYLGESESSTDNSNFFSLVKDTEVSVVITSANILNAGREMYIELWKDGKETYEDRQTLLINTTAIDGKSGAITVDLDNEYECISIDSNKRTLYANDFGTGVRVYNGNKLVSLEEETYTFEEIVDYQGLVDYEALVDSNIQFVQNSPYKGSDFLNICTELFAQNKEDMFANDDVIYVWIPDYSSNDHYYKITKTGDDNIQIHVQAFNGNINPTITHEYTHGLDPVYKRSYILFRTGPNTRIDPIKQTIEITVTYDGTEYKKTFTVSAVESPTLFKLNPLQSSISFAPPTESRNSFAPSSQVISCGILKVCNHVQEKYSGADYDIWSEIGYGNNILQSFTKLAKSYGVSLVSITPDPSNMNIKPTWVKFYLLDKNDIDKDDAIDIETVPILYDGVDGKLVEGYDLRASRTVVERNYGIYGNSYESGQSVVYFYLWKGENQVPSSDWLLTCNLVQNYDNIEISGKTLVVSQIPETSESIVLTCNALIDNVLKGSIDITLKRNIIDDYDISISSNEITYDEDQELYTPSSVRITCIQNNIQNPSDSLNISLTDITGVQYPTAEWGVVISPSNTYTWNSENNSLTPTGTYDSVKNGIHIDVKHLYNDIYQTITSFDIGIKKNTIPTLPEGLDDIKQNIDYRIIVSEQSKATYSANASGSTYGLTILFGNCKLLKNSGGEIWEDVTASLYKIKYINPKTGTAEDIPIGNSTIITEVSANQIGNILLMAYGQFGSDELQTYNSSYDSYDVILAYSYISSTVVPLNGSLYTITSSDYDEIANIVYSNIGEVSTMYAMEGEFDPTHNYTRDEYVPLVYFHEQGQEKGYWWELIKPNTTGTGVDTRHWAPGDHPNNVNILSGYEGVVYDHIGRLFYWNGDQELSDDASGIYVNEYWKKVDRFNTVVTDAVFADFAKLGSAVICGDFMFSLHGTINGLYYGVGSAFNNTAPYLWFMPGVSLSSGDSAVIYDGTYNENAGIKIEIKHPDGYNSADGKWTSFDTGIDIYGGRPGLTFNIKVTTVNKDSSINFGIEKEDSLVSVRAESDPLSTIDDTNFSFLRNRFNNLYAYVNHNISTPSKKTGTIKKIEILNATNVFKPSWAVDLKTGKMVAGSGNFIVEPDGSIYTKGKLIQLTTFIKEDNYNIYSKAKPGDMNLVRWNDTEIPSDRVMYIPENSQNVVLKLDQLSDQDFGALVIPYAETGYEFSIFLTNAPNGGAGIHQLLVLPEELNNVDVFDISNEAHYVNGIYMNDSTFITLRRIGSSWWVMNRSNNIDFKS